MDRRCRQRKRQAFGSKKAARRGSLLYFWCTTFDGDVRVPGYPSCALAESGSVSPSRTA